jgi:hypothetical protein
MSANDVDEHMRDARLAHHETAVSLRLLGDKLSDVQAALAAGNQTRAKRAIAAAAAELDAAHGYVAAARDAHRDISRSTKAAA